MFKRNKPVGRREYLACKPLRTPRAVATRKPDGGAALVVPVQGRWPFRFPAGATRTIELDAMGLHVWDLCDGSATIAEIIARFTVHFSLPPADAETAMLKFVTMLAQRRLIGVAEELAA